MRANLLSKLRPPPLVHQWDFWHDRQEPKSHARTSSTSHGHGRSTSTSSLNPANSNGGSTAYEDRLTLLHTITDVRSFWNVFNNFDVSKLPMRDSVHLFHKGVKPVWEDPRNEKGGCWTFRVPKEKVQAFWQELCLMAVGEKLQDALAQPGRSSEPHPSYVPAHLHSDMLQLSSTTSAVSPSPCASLPPTSASGIVMPNIQTVYRRFSRPS
jgi:hypothetical protein